MVDWRKEYFELAENFKQFKEEIQEALSSVNYKLRSNLQRFEWKIASLESMDSLERGVHKWLRLKEDVVVTSQDVEGYAGKVFSYKAGTLFEGKVRGRYLTHYIDEDSNMYYEIPANMFEVVELEDEYLRQNQHIEIVYSR